MIKTEKPMLAVNHQKKWQFKKVRQRNLEWMDHLEIVPLELVPQLLKHEKWFSRRKPMPLRAKIDMIQEYNVDAIH
jgi:hypothetical protein